MRSSSPNPYLALNMEYFATKAATSRFFGQNRMKLCMLNGWLLAVGGAETGYTPNSIRSLTVYRFDRIHRREPLPATISPINSSRSHGSIPETPRNFG
jgi:hypothetical protein